jgi:hypothetical protein
MKFGQNENIMAYLITNGRKILKNFFLDILGFYR